MHAVLLFLPLFVAALPAVAGFAPEQQVQTLRLAYGQRSVRVVFQTADGSSVTRAKPDCDCTTLQWEGSRLVAVVDTSTFDAPVEKKVLATTSDGARTTLTMRFEVPQAVVISSPALLWERNAPPAPQVFRISLPQGSPVRALLSADLSGNDFDFETRTLSPGREYSITVTPKSTARRCLNRLVIKMDGPAPLYHQRLLYLRVR